MACASKARGIGGFMREKLECQAVHRRSMVLALLGRHLEVRAAAP